jgi:hypothetical protein
MGVLRLNLRHQPPVVTFNPTDEQVINCYLRPKMANKDEQLYFIPEVHFFKCEPCDLPGDHFTNPSHLFKFNIYESDFSISGLQLISSLFS